MLTLPLPVMVVEASFMLPDVIFLKRPPLLEENAIVPKTRLESPIEFDPIVGLEMDVGIETTGVGALLKVESQRYSDCCWVRCQTQPL